MANALRSGFLDESLQELEWPPPFGISGVNEFLVGTLSESKSCE